MPLCIIGNPFLSTKIFEDDHDHRTWFLIFKKFKKNIAKSNGSIVNKISPIKQGAVTQ